MKRQTRYQVRITKFIWAGHAYTWAGLIGLLLVHAPVVAWVVYLSTITLIYCIASVSDAIFDSLNERVNIQSSWLHTRLSVVEERLGARSGQEQWLNDAVPTNDPAHYFESYPEKLEENA